jgi:farnesyl-diphosphate farnesyltransferase
MLLLREPGQALAILSLWEVEPWPALTESERRLMGVTDGHLLWVTYAQLPQTAREVVQRWTREMAEGMRQLATPDQRPCFVERQGIAVIAEATDYDAYCYYVAGTVGHMASELAVTQYQLAPAIAQALEPYAEACGRSLQKTNIIKDFAGDLNRGICYLPDAWLQTVAYMPLALQGATPAWKALVLGDVLAELRAATDYLLALPYTATGYRRASLLCLLPAYQTMLVAAQRQEILFTSEHQIKISRLTMAQCVADSQALLFDNTAIRRYGQRVEEKIQSQFGQQVLLPKR